jgi:hypothetical protein
MLFASSAAIAASSFEIDCGELGSPRSAPADVTDKLDFRVVDLTSGAESGLDDLEGLTSADDASAAPHLYLGPRVANIVRDVFGDTNPDRPAAVAGPLGVGLEALAESNRDTNEAAVETDVDDDDAPYSPLRIHREMYRTDI